MCNKRFFKDISILSPIPSMNSHVHLSAMLRHVTYATIRESGTSRGIRHPPKTPSPTHAIPSHRPVGGKTRRCAGPRRSCSAFWRQFSTADHRFDPAFGRGPGPGTAPAFGQGLAALGSHMDLTSLRPLYYSLEGFAITVESSNFNLVRCFD